MQEKVTYRMVGDKRSYVISNVRDWIVSPQNTYIKASNSREVIRVKWGDKHGPQSHRTGVVIKKERDPDISPLVPR